jgi:Holliday junction resolvase RusA-like endonuclease
MIHKQTFNIKPRSKQRPRSTRSGHTYTPKETREYEKKISEAYSGVAFVDGPLEVELVFDNDKTTIVIKELKPAKNPSKLRGDIDNYAKAILDALNNVAYTDDKQIVSLKLRKK